MAALFLKTDAVSFQFTKHGFIYFLNGGNMNTREFDLTRKNHFCSDSQAVSPRF